jgi:hypothetical protein
MTVGTRTTPRRPSGWRDPGPAALGTARAAGLLYLGLVLTGVLGFLVIRPQLFTGDAATALTRLVDQESLARLGIAVELGVVVTQALAAVWFYRLFHPVDAVSAGALAAFGLVNATVILGSAASLATALELARDPVGDATGQVRLLVGLSANLWGVGALFFGLWLVPMGLLVLRSVGMPRSLGWLLLGGGVGYVLSAFVAYLAPGAQPVADALTIPATVGELWMIGYLLHGGVFRSPATDATPATAAA